MIDKVRAAQIDFRSGGEDVIEDFMNDVFEHYSSEDGVDTRGYDKLSEIDSDAWEWSEDLGKKETGILELYMLAFKLAMEQIKNQTAN